VFETLDDANPSLRSDSVQEVLMTACGKLTVWQWSRATLFIVPGLLIAVATSLTAQSSSASATEQFSSEQQLAAYHPSDTALSEKTQLAVPERETRGRIAEARRLLKELQLFIEDTARTVELDNRLKIRTQENDQLKQALSTSRVANTVLESKAIPMEQARSDLTGRVVRNWLEAVRLKYRVNEADRELTMSEESWSGIAGRVGELRRDLIARRAEVQYLRSMTSALKDEIDNTRLKVEQAHKTAYQLEHQRDLIIDASAALRRDVMSRLRRALLEAGD
jgi:hypothetical protein